MFSVRLSDLPHRDFRKSIELGEIRYPKGEIGATEREICIRYRKVD